MANLSGTVKNTANVALPNRKVRAYRRDTGALLGETLSSDGSEVPGDSNYPNVLLLLPFDASPFVDSSPTPRTVTNVGGVALAGSQFRYGGGSAGPFASAARLTVPSFPEVALPLDFTVESWVYIIGSSPSLQGIFNIGQYNSGCMWRLQSSLIEFWINNNQMTWSWAMPTGAWFHLALVRKNGKIRIYKDGVVLDTFNSNGNSIAAGEVMLGTASHATTSEYLNGYLDDFRLTKGVGRYGPFFDPPASLPTTVGGDASYASVGLLLKGVGADGSTTFTDSGPDGRSVTRTGTGITISTAQSKYDGSSILFSGTASEYLSLTTDADFDFGTGDFTVEFWAYRTKAGTLDFINFMSGGATRLLFYIFNAELSMYDTVAGVTVTAVYTMPTSTWVHLAWCRTGNTLKIFVNGDELASAAYTATAPAGCDVHIGRSWTGGSGREFGGYIDDLRITKGVCRYSIGPNSFTPPNQHPTGLIGYTPDVGDFTIPVGSFSGESTVIIYDEDAGSKNAIVYDRVTPI